MNVNECMAHMITPDAKYEECNNGNECLNNV